MNNNTKPKRVESLKWLWSVALVLPLVLFLVLVFIYPIWGMIKLSVHDVELSEVMPNTVVEIDRWDQKDLPDPLAYAAVASDLQKAASDRTAGTAARRLSYESAENRAIIMQTARALRSNFDADANWKVALPQINAAWGNPEIWRSIQNAAGPRSDFFLLSALDLKRAEGGAIERIAEQQRLYVDVLLRTLIIALSVTVISVALALPAAYLISSSGPRIAGMLLILLLLPLWTSLLVRTASWMVILQTNGLVNTTLINIGLIAEPLELMFNRTGVLIGLSHILVPYAVLPLIATMRSVPANQTLAASSLGAGACRTFFTVYLPQIATGLSAATLLVFILALGYYITPLLLGGAGDQILPYYIAFNITRTVNWGLAAALGVILLVATFILYTVYVRLVGADRIGLG